MDIAESDPAAGLEFHLVLAKRDGLADLGGRHVVQQNDVIAGQSHEGADLFQVVGLHFNPQTGSLPLQLFEFARPDRSNPGSASNDCP